MGTVARHTLFVMLSGTLAFKWNHQDEIGRISRFDNCINISPATFILPYTTHQLFHHYLLTYPSSSFTPSSSASRSWTSFLREIQTFFCKAFIRRKMWKKRGNLYVNMWSTSRFQLTWNKTRMLDYEEMDFSQKGIRTLVCLFLNFCFNHAFVSLKSWKLISFYFKD